MMLKNKKVLVVGAGGLLGTCLVKELLTQGAKVLATDINLDQLNSRLKSVDVDVSNHYLTIKEIDIANKASLIALLDETDSLTGAVNCSYPRNKNYGKHFFDVHIDDFNENISLNLGSAFLFMQQCASYFMQNKTPFSLVNISSVYGVVAPKFEIYQDTSMTMPVEYAAIKSGLLHLAKYVASYVNDSNFKVNSVSPGGLYDGQPEAFLAKYKENTFGKGMLHAEDILGSIVFLLSDKSQYINMQNIIVDDGFTG